MIVPTYPEFSLPSLSKYMQARYLNYAKQVLEAQQQMMTARGKTILHYTLRRKRQHQYMDHYPAGDRIDYDTGAQYFYHCHREDYDTTEHGHFHCFLRYPHIAPRIKPTPLPDWDINMDSPMTHIIAISMSCDGQPMRLFTVNRCVSYEVWYDAKHIQRFINQYKMTKQDDPYWQILDRWVDGMIHLFAPQIVWLQHARDITIEHYKQVLPGTNVYENQDLQELSTIPINVADQIQWILAAENTSTQSTAQQNKEPSITQ